MDDIVSKEQNLKEGYIGNPVVGRNLAQGIIVEKFPDILFDGGSLGVKPPDSPRMGLRIGDQDMIGIFAVFEERELSGLDRVFGDRTSYHDKSMDFFPAMGFVLKFPHFPSIAKRFETTGSGSRFDRGILFGNYGIANSFLVEQFDHLFVEQS
jgi:hypothetical protein